MSINRGSHFELGWLQNWINHRCSFNNNFLTVISKLIQWFMRSFCWQTKRWKATLTADVSTHNRAWGGTCMSYFANGTDKQADSWWFRLRLWQRAMIMTMNVFASMNNPMLLNVPQCISKSSTALLQEKRNERKSHLRGEHKSGGGLHLVIPALWRIYSGLRAPRVV